VLTWDRFFKVRRNRRWLNAGCSLVTAVSSVAIGAPLLAQQDFDTWAAQASGLDPIIVMGISTFGIAAAGWLLGPVFGNGGFRIWAGRKGWTKEIAGKEKSFYARIKKYRADASSSSPQNPIPDYYGEKVASVKDYRRWLKDQKAFNLKKNKNMI
jgi:import inner membrane translocase subunit TIM23